MRDRNEPPAKRQAKSVASNGFASDNAVNHGEQGVRHRQLLVLCGRADVELRSTCESDQEDEVNDDQAEVFAMGIGDYLGVYGCWWSYRRRAFRARRWRAYIRIALR
ncbi:MAG: hypothetical protein OXH68_13360 [Gammaproteobacteria bacterium]|nr:hypothetical protein [Gammaproteobacteria bacterium]